MATAIISVALAVVAALVIRYMIRKKKSGKTHCGGDCSRCNKGCH